MKNNNIYLNLGIVLLLLIAVFKFGVWFGEIRAEQDSLRNDFNAHRDDARARLHALEEERTVRQCRWGWATKAWTLGKKLPVVRWIAA